LTAIVPSVTFRKGTTNANSAIVMRGVGTISFSVAAEPSVSTVVDGIVLSRSGQSFLDLVDIDRLEVLRGPQGTLFGKNASAGLINIVSRGGTKEFEADFSVSAFTDEEYRGRFSASGPIAGDLTTRVTAFFGTYAGNLTNIAGGRENEVNGYEHYGARGLLDYQPEGARVRLIADYFRADDDCCAEVTGVSRGAVLDRELGFDTTRGENGRIINQNLVTRSLDRQWSLTLNADFDIFEEHTLSLITGYRNWINTELRDGDFLPRALVEAAQLHDRGRVETDQLSGEIRLASPQDQTLSYQLGAFAWYSKNEQDFTRRDITCTAATPVDPRTGARPCNVANLALTSFPTATSRSDVKFNNYAVYGQATFSVTDTLRLIAGLRYTRDELEYTHTRAPGINAATGLPATGPGISGLGAGGSLAAGGNGTNTLSGETESDNLSGRGVLQFDITDDVMTYASYTRGYKGPAFNVFFNMTAPQNAVPIDEETSDSYEVGIRSRLFDRLLQFNASAFHVEYQGFQANNFVLLNGAVVTNLTNAGTVRSRGFEVDAILSPVRGLDFRANLAYADAEVKRFNPNPLTNAPDARNGTRLPLAPRLSYTVGADYEANLGSARLFLGTDYHHVSKQFSDLGEQGPIAPYGLWNASIGIADATDTYRLSFIVKNILDDSYVLLNTTAGQRLQIPRDADRYAGVILRVGLR
jgi:iron complex outermembrane receptor protein